MTKNPDYGSQKLFYECFYDSVIFGKGIGASAVRRTHSTMEKPWGGTLQESPGSRIREWRAPRLRKAWF